MMNTEIQEIHKKLDALIASQAPAPDLKKELWGVEHIAEYFSVARATARNKFVKTEGFPRPKKIVTPNGVTKRWKSDAVRSWGDRQ